MTIKDGNGDASLLDDLIGSSIAVLPKTYLNRDAKVAMETGRQLWRVNEPPVHRQERVTRERCLTS